MYEHAVPWEKPPRVEPKAKKPHLVVNSKRLGEPHQLPTTGSVADNVNRKTSTQLISSVDNREQEPLILADEESADATRSAVVETVDADASRLHDEGTSTTKLGMTALRTCSTPLT
jgi:hypothetical protein